MIILLMAIGGYYIDGFFCYFMLHYDYWWLLYHKLLLDILVYIIIGY